MVDCTFQCIRREPDDGPEPSDDEVLAAKRFVQIVHPDLRPEEDAAEFELFVMYRIEQQRIERRLLAGELRTGG